MGKHSFDNNYPVPISVKGTSSNHAMQTATVCLQKILNDSICNRDSRYNLSTEKPTKYQQVPKFKFYVQIKIL